MVARASARLRNTCSVETFVAQAAAEVFDEGILHGPARSDVASVEPTERPAPHRRAGQFAAVIG